MDTTCAVILIPTYPPVAGRSGGSRSRRTVLRDRIYDFRVCVFANDSKPEISVAPLELRRP